MLLTISTTHQPATDLGFLLHKHPDRVHHATLSFGEAHVFFPQASEERCTAALLVEVDPVALVRNSKSSGREGDASLQRYVNDRPYAASSFTSVALNRCFSTALAGRCNERPDLAATPIDLVANLPVVPSRGGEEVLRQMFEPLGYDVAATPLALDGEFPEWGDSRYFAVELSGRVRLAELLQHLFVLLPVLDDHKHYWVGEDEVDKLLRRGDDWIASHPHREFITERYLRHDRILTKDALSRLSEDGLADSDDPAVTQDADEAAVEETISLNEQRMNAVVAAIQVAGARKLVDLGCGEGRLLQRLLLDTKLERILGIDVSHRALERASRRLRLETMTPRQRSRVELAQGSLSYRDRRLTEFDVATVVEVIEHIDPLRLPAFERALFQHARPPTVVVTTPNREYNERFVSLPGGALRHRDHRFEWTRGEFAEWASGVATRRGYEVELSGIGPEDDDLGCPTQMAVFSR